MTSASTPTRPPVATGPADPAHPTRPKPASGWLAITGLLLLCALPVISGLLRLGEAGATHEGPSQPFFVAVSVGHIVGMSVFCVLGAFQFSPALRIRRRWHRRVGWVLLPAGLVAAVSSLPIGLIFGGPPEEQDLAFVRAFFAVVMIACLALGALAVRRRDFATHGAWMTRSIALGVSGGTQALVAIVWSLGGAEVDAAAETWVVAIGFVVNLLVAELVIQRRRRSVRAAA